MQMPVQRRLPPLHHPVILQGLLRRIHNQQSSVPIQQRRLTLMKPRRDVRQPHHRRNRHRPGHDRAVTRMAPRLRRKPQHPRPVHHRRVTRRNIQRQQNVRLIVRRRIRMPAQHPHHPPRHIINVRHPLPQILVIHPPHPVHVARHHLVKRPLRLLRYFPHQSLHFLNQRPVLQHQLVRIKNKRVIRPSLLRHPVPQRPQLLLRLRKRRMKPLQLPSQFLLLHTLLTRHIKHVRRQTHRPLGNPRGNPDADQHHFMSHVIMQRSHRKTVEEAGKRQLNALPASSATVVPTNSPDSPPPPDSRLPNPPPHRSSH